MDRKNKDYDIVVIGGGPAGMIAAGRAAECGARVVLLEKNRTLGKKLLITGGGRCNITNAERDPKKFVGKLGAGAKALLSPFTRFGVAETIAFFEKRGLPLKVEENLRMFPQSDSAQDVWNTLAEYMREGTVTVRCGARVDGFVHEGNAITGVRVGKEIIKAKKYVLATGGASRPETGSTGEGLGWLRSIGHAVQDADLALVPIKIKDAWVKKLAGLSVAHAKLTVFHAGKKEESRSGKLLFTHFGISGPLVINMSRGVADLFKYGPVELRLDMFPDEDIASLDTKLLATLSGVLNKKIKNAIDVIIPARMVSVVLDMAQIDPEKQANVLAREERLRVVHTLKALPMNVAGFMGVEKAVVTSGGVSVGEVDFKTMQSKLFSNLYLVGDILNFDRPTGGYSLQICWTSGYIAGEHAALNEHT